MALTDPSSSSFVLYSLPSEIFRIIEQYLGNHSSVILPLLKANSQLQLKLKDIFHLQLNKQFSLQFLQDPIFHQRVRRSVNASSSQISLTLENANFDEIHLISSDVFHHLYHINLQNCSVLPPLSYFQHINSIDFSRSVAINDLSDLPVSTINKISLNYCPQLRDVSVLAECTSVSLRGCLNISDVNCLGAVPHLDLSHNSLLEDISGLGQGNITLDLSFCPKIKDVKHLWKVQKLNLNYCRLAEGIDYLREHVSFLSAIH